MFSDPACHLAAPAEGFGAALPARLETASEEEIAAMDPRRDEVDVERETLVVWDGGTALSLAPLLGSDLMPAAPVVPRWCSRPSPAPAHPERARTLKGRGFEVRSVAGARHTVHRDDFDGFTASPEEWAPDAPSPGAMGTPGPGMSVPRATIELTL
ncbi:hypothetical protein [Streptomyces yangpuensis]|uniref:hypothetical protein n=1 Tax=Streptomyces yangpuensis TaxID=1648182 RepID=UPI0036687C0B